MIEVLAALVLFVVTFIAQFLALFIVLAFFTFIVVVILMALSLVWAGHRWGWRGPVGLLLTYGFVFVVLPYILIARPF